MKAVVVIIFYFSFESARKISAPMTAMMAAINAYSIRDAPDSSIKNLEMARGSYSFVRMLFSMFNAVGFIFY
jgi:hypothetical protein